MNIKVPFFGFNKLVSKSDIVHKTFLMHVCIVYYIGYSTQLLTLKKLKANGVVLVK